MENIDFAALVEKGEDEVLKLSDQAVGALQLALVKSLAEQTDIVETIKSWNLKNTEEGLIVMNPNFAKIPNVDA